MNFFDLVKIFSYLPNELAVFIMAMIPVLELQVSIPIALGVYKMDILSAYVWSVSGNLVPAVLLLLFLGPLSNFLMKRFRLFDRLFHWIFFYTRNKFTQKYLKYGEVALFLFIAIPTPFSGSWSSSVAAFLFNIPFRRAFLLIASGELVAGFIIIGLTKGTLIFFHI